MKLKRLIVINMICSICNEKGHRSNNKKYHPTYELIKRQDCYTRKIKE